MRGGRGRIMAGIDDISLIVLAFSSGFKAPRTWPAELTKPVPSTIVPPTRLGAVFDDDRHCTIGLYETTGPDRGGHRSPAGQAFVRFAFARRDRTAETADRGDALFEPRRGKTAAAVSGGRERGRVRRCARGRPAGRRRARMHPLLFSCS